MRALIFDGRLQVRDDHPMPEPPPGEVRVRVRRAGICRTDVEITRGYMDHRGVLGHEFVGELADGSRVVGEINAYDATCETCRRGDVTQCENRTVLGIFRRDGAMAEYVTLPARGTLVLKSTFHGVHPLALAPLVVDEVTLVGSRCGPFPPAMRLLEQHLIEVDALLDAEYPLAHGIEAFARASAPGALKVQLVMEGGSV